MTVVHPEIPLAGVIVDIVSNTAGMAIVVTGLAAGALRALAVLGNFSPERVEWMTAAGFAGGLALAMLFLSLDTVLS